MVDNGIARFSPLGVLDLLRQFLCWLPEAKLFSVHNRGEMAVAVAVESQSHKTFFLIFFDIISLFCKRLPSGGAQLSHNQYIGRRQQWTHDFVDVA